MGRVTVVLIEEVVVLNVEGKEGGRMSRDAKRALAFSAAMGMREMFRLLI